MSKTLAALRDRLSEQIGDLIQETVTTALAASNSVVDTNLAAYTGNNDYFNRYWCLITSLANSGVNRKISDYVASTTTLTILGAALASDAAAKATFEIHRYDPANKKKAINAASRELKDYLFRHVEWDSTLVSGNWLPNGHFEDWTATTNPDYTAVTNSTATANTSVIRGGKRSAKVSATAANGYMAYTSSTYPRLLNLQGQTVSAYVWVYPEVADDATIVIYTLQADSTAQTLTSTTTCPAGKWTRLELEDQVLNDDLVDIQIRFKVATNAKYAYFDNARLVGPNPHEYVLPLDFQTGTLSTVRLQTSGQSDDICDDVYTTASQTEPIWNWMVSNQEGVRFLRFELPLPTEAKIILQGTALLETLSADTDTMSIDDPYTDLLISCACWKLFEMEMGLPSAEDISRVAQLVNYWRQNTEMLKRSHRMHKPPSQTRWLNA